MVRQGQGKFRRRPRVASREQGGRGTPGKCHKPALASPETTCTAAVHTPACIPPAQRTRGSRGASGLVGGPQGVFGYVCMAWKDYIGAGQQGQRRK